jgi:hypothetical protein
MRRNTKPDGEEYWEYLIVYVDDICAISHDAAAILAHFQSIFKMKDVGPPTRYLGATIGKHKVEGSGFEFWYLSANEYLKNVIKVIEEKCRLMVKDVTTPTASNFHPELDTSELLDDTQTSYYQSLVGTLQWLVELGRIDIHYATSCMAKFSASPRKNHLHYVHRIFSYLKSHLRSRVVFDYTTRDWSNKEWMVYDWFAQYPEAKDELPPHMPIALGKPVQINFFSDASFATDLSNRHSQSGIIIFLNSTPIRWFSKRQNTIETSAYGAEFVALKIAGELVEALRYKLRMMGVALDGPANGFVDNEGVVLNSTIPSSTLKKKHNSVAYHKTRELVACNIIRIAKEPGETNLADVLTKGLGGPKHKYLMSRILH